MQGRSFKKCSKCYREANSNRQETCYTCKVPKSEQNFIPSARVLKGGKKGSFGKTHQKIKVVPLKKKVLKHRTLKHRTLKHRTFSVRKTTTLQIRTWNCARTTSTTLIIRFRMKHQKISNGCMNLMHPCNMISI